MNADRHVHNVGHHLHNERRFFCHTTQSYQSFYRNTFVVEAVNNGFSAKAGSFYNSSEDTWCIAAEIEAGNGAFQLLAGIGGTTAIEPVNCQFAVLIDLYLRCLFT